MEPFIKGRFTLSSIELTRVRVDVVDDNVVVGNPK